MISHRSGLYRNIVYHLQHSTRRKVGLFARSA
jgi:hypothetical protein